MRFIFIYIILSFDMFVGLNLICRCVRFVDLNLISEVIDLLMDLNCRPIDILISVSFIFR